MGWQLVGGICLGIIREATELRQDHGGSQGKKEAAGAHFKQDDGRVGIANVSFCSPCA